MPAIQTFPSKFRRSSLSGGRTPVSNQTPLILVSAAVVSAAGLAPSSALTSVPSSASTAASNEPPRVMARWPSSMPVMFDGTSSGEKDEKSCVVVAHVVNSWARFDVGDRSRELGDGRGIRRDTPDGRRVLVQLQLRGPGQQRVIDEFRHVGEVDGHDRDRGHTGTRRGAQRRDELGGRFDTGRHVRRRTRRTGSSATWVQSGTFAERPASWPRSSASPTQTTTRLQRPAASFRPPPARRAPHPWPTDPRANRRRTATRHRAPPAAIRSSRRPPSDSASGADHTAKPSPLTAASMVIYPTG